MVDVLGIPVEAHLKIFQYFFQDANVVISVRTHRDTTGHGAQVRGKFEVSVLYRCSQLHKGVSVRLQDCSQHVWSHANALTGLRNLTIQHGNKNSHGHFSYQLKPSVLVDKTTLIVANVCKIHQEHFFDLRTRLCLRRRTPARSSSLYQHDRTSFVILVDHKS